MQLQTTFAKTLLLLCLVAGTSATHARLFSWDKDFEAERSEIQEARGKALTKLYAEKPGSEKMLAESKGYAVFSNIGVNLFLISTQHGSGVLRDNRSAEDIYLKMLSGGGGVGLGVKNFAAIFVFHTDAALDLFLSEGWDFSAQADANMETGTQGDGMETAYTAMPGTTLYQLTDAGVAAQVTLQGTKFWRDEDLN